MGFIWTTRKPTEGIATLYNSNITLNKSASYYFENIRKVLLGLDVSTNRVAIKPITKEMEDSGIYSKEKLHKITVKPSYARVCNKNFMNELSELNNLTFTDNQSYKFKAVWNDKDSALIINLENTEE